MEDQEEYQIINEDSIKEEVGGKITQERRENRMKKRNTYMRGWWTRPGNKEKRIEKRKEKRFFDPKSFILYKAKERARNTGIEFLISGEDFDLPTICPVLEIPIVYGLVKATDNSPSIDRIDNEKGYIPGNVRIISHRANTIKSSGSAVEHQAIAIYMEANLFRQRESIVSRSAYEGYESMGGGV